MRTLPPESAETHDPIEVAGFEREHQPRDLVGLLPADESLQRIERLPVDHPVGTREGAPAVGEVLVAAGALGRQRVHEVLRVGVARWPLARVLVVE